MNIVLVQQDDLAILTLNRPDKLNALSFEMLGELDAALDRLRSATCKVVIVRGAGEKAFCAGADIEELRNRPLLAQKHGAEFGQAVFEKLSNLPLISIACLNGYTFGGGLELALACTFRIASQSARMGLPEIKLGLIPGYGGTQRLPRLIGIEKAMGMILTGRTVGAEEAERIGLVSQLVDQDIFEVAKTFASSITRHSLPALQFARDAVRRSSEVALTEGLRLEADLSTLAYQTEDAAEGMAAFIEKREPHFRDQ
jgi:enoyl-CoA hydratase